MVKYRLLNDIIIPAGTEVETEPPHTREYATTVGTVAVNTVIGSLVEIVFDLDDALSEGMVEVVE